MSIPSPMLPRLLSIIRAAGVAIDGVDENSQVTPPALQAAAQPTIAAFDASQAAHNAWLRLQERSAAAAAVDGDRNFTVMLVLAVLAALVDELVVIFGGIPRAVSSITRSNTVATVNTAAPHNLGPNGTTRTVGIHGADVAAYNGLKTITVTGPSAFTYPIAGSPATPATGSLFYALNGNPPVTRTLEQAISAVKAKINAGSVD